MPNHTMQRMRASRLAWSQIESYWRLARTADGGRCPERVFMMGLATFRRKALTNDLEVEHILRAARDRLPGLGDELERLIIECEWTNGGGSAQAPIIPFRRWAETAITYERFGYEGLRKLFEDEAFFPFVVAILTELHSEVAVRMLMDQADALRRQPSQDFDRLYRIAAAFNSLLFPKHPVLISEALRGRIRKFLHGLLQKPTMERTESRLALVACTLRGAGDLDSVDRIAALPELPPPWKTAPGTAIRAIKKRMKSHE